jgi:hypothetical protein
MATFEPWLPWNFDGTLLLGESTFRGNDTKGLTGHGRGFDALIEFDVRYWLIGQVVDAAIHQDKPFYKAMRKTLHPELSPIDCWFRTAHAEFVQDPLDSNRARRDWPTAQRGLPALVGRIRPKRVLVASSTVWQKLPNWRVDRRDGVELCQGWGAVWGWTYHPRSARFRPENARKVVCALYAEEPDRATSPGKCER